MMLEQLGIGPAQQSLTPENMQAQMIAGGQTPPNMQPQGYKEGSSVISKLGGPALTAAMFAPDIMDIVHHLKNKDIGSAVGQAVDSGKWMLPLSRLVPLALLTHSEELGAGTLDDYLAKKQAEREEHFNQLQQLSPVVRKDVNMYGLPYDMSKFKPQAQQQAQPQPQPQQPQTNYLQGGLPQQSPLDVPEGMYDYLNNRPISDQ
jgi:hypothetical protein